MVFCLVCEWFSLCLCVSCDAILRYPPFTQLKVQRRLHWACPVGLCDALGLRAGGWDPLWVLRLGMLLRCWYNVVFTQQSQQPNFPVFIIRFLLLQSETIKNYYFFIFFIFIFISIFIFIFIIIFIIVFSFYLRFFHFCSSPFAIKLHFFICNFIFSHLQLHFFSFSFVFDGFPLFFIVFHGFPGFQVPRARKMKKNDKK